MTSSPERRKPFVYKAPTYEQMLRHLRRHQMPEAIRHARRGDPTKLCEYVRSYPSLAAEFAPDIADLLAIARYPKLGHHRRQTRNWLRQASSPPCALGSAR